MNDMTGKATDSPEKMSDPALGVLLKEYEIHRTELRQRFDHQLQGGYFILSIVMIALGLGLKDNITTIFLLLPWFLIGCLAYLGHQAMVTRLTVAYIRELESRLVVLDYERNITAELWERRRFAENPYKILSVLALLPYDVVYSYSLARASIWLAESDHILLCIVFPLFTLGTTVGIIVASLWGLQYAKHLPPNRAVKAAATD